MRRERKKLHEQMCVTQDFGCSRDDFNCQCPQVVNASSNAPAVPAAELACIASPAAAPAPLIAAPAAVPSLAAAAAPVSAAASPEAAAALSPLPAPGEIPSQYCGTQALPLSTPRDTKQLSHTQACRHLPGRGKRNNEVSCHALQVQEPHPALGPALQHRLSRHQQLRQRPQCPPPAQGCPCLSPAQPQCLPP